MSAGALPNAVDGDGRGGGRGGGRSYDTIVVVGHGEFMHYVMKKVGRQSPLLSLSRKRPLSLLSCRAFLYETSPLVACEPATHHQVGPSTGPNDRDFSLSKGLSFQ